MRRHFVLLTVSVALVMSACSSSSKKSATTPTSGGNATTTLAPNATPIGHVFVINLENKSYNQTWGSGSPARYLNKTLRPQGKLLTKYYGVAHASLGNYIAQISGQAPNPETQADCVRFNEFVSTGKGRYGQALGHGCVYPKSVKTLADQLLDARFTWKTFQEDMATPCQHPAIGGVDTTVKPKPGKMYATRHNPFVYFHSIIDTPACRVNVLNLTELAEELVAVEETPNLVYITPNVCNDGHDEPCVDGKPGGLKSADAWLKKYVPKILASPAFKADGLLVITFDEAEGDDASACCKTPKSPNTESPGIHGPGGGRVGALLISPRVAPGTTDATPYNHYALLCSIEDIFHLDHLGFAGAPGLRCFGDNIYDAK